MSRNKLEARRQFIRFLAASPFAILPVEFARAYPDRAMPTSLKEVLNIFQLDRVAQRLCPLMSITLLRVRRMMELPIRQILMPMQNAACGHDGWPMSVR